LKTKLAASAGSESLLEFLLTEAGSDASVSNISSFIKSLETKLESSEARIASLAAQIAGFTSDASLSKALEREAMARQALADVEVKLASYERVFGPNASGEMAELAKKLEEKTKEVKRLELMVKENDSATDALYSEVERLSKAWEDVAARVESKVFHLRDAEEKVARLATEVCRRSSCQGKFVMSESSSIPPSRRPRRTTSILPRCALRKPSTLSARRPSAMLKSKSRSSRSSLNLRGASRVSSRSRRRR
jgi:chromosome segregation ATPase